MLRLTTAALGATAVTTLMLTAAAGTAAAGTAAVRNAAAAAAQPACTTLPVPGAASAARAAQLCVRVQATGPTVRAGTQAGYLVSVWAVGSKAHQVSVRIAAASSPVSPAVPAPVFASCGGGSGAGSQRCTFGPLTAGSGRATGLPAQVTVPAAAPGGDQVTLSATAHAAATGGAPMSLTAAATVPVKARPTSSPSPSPTRSRTPTPRPSSPRTPPPKPSSSSTPTPKPSNSRPPTPKPSNSRTSAPKPSGSSTRTPKPSSSRTRKPAPSATRSRTPSPRGSAGSQQGGHSHNRSAHPSGHGTGTPGGGSGTAGTMQPPLPKLPALDAPQPAGQPGTGSVAHLFPAIRPSPSPASDLPAGSVFPHTGSPLGRGTRDPAQPRVTTAADSAPTDAPLAGGQLAALVFLLVAAGLTVGAARARARRRG